MLQPEISIIDSHVHLWDPRRFKMGWIKGSEQLDRSYQLDDYSEHIRGLPVEGFVFVEAGLDSGNELEEVEWVAGLARRDARLKGIVAAAPVEQGEALRPFLEKLVEISPLVKGVRRLLQGEADPYYCLQPDFIRGVQLLSQFGLSFDICIKHIQLPGVIELVRRCPQTSFILDHIAKPAIKQAELDPWRENIHELASLPNVVCKISGLVTEADHQHWQAVELAPYVAHILESFGEERVMFGSDWPVILLATAYSRWVETLNHLTSHLSDEARQRLWATNAKKYYQL
ncbi:MAG TPA: amidohydrolase family protein [Chloroflexia bacterium]|nr:amidohydrolase family protein [Chloroflexia bacterium]